MKARIERYKKIIAELREEKINSELEAPKQIEINNENVVGFVDDMKNFTELIYPYIDDGLFFN